MLPQDSPQPGMTDPFETFMKAHQNLVFSVAVRLLANRAEAADICQETFLRAHTHFESLKDNPAARGWLRTVATNLALNHLTRHRARWRVFTDVFREDSTLTMEDQLAAPDTRTEEEEQDYRRRYLESALSRLPDAQRVPLVLYHFQDMSYDTIAEHLGVSLSKVKTDIHRGRESLRRWLRPDLHGWEETTWMKSDAAREDDSGITPRLPWTTGLEGCLGAI